MSHRDWMYVNLIDKSNRAIFTKGVEEFLDFAFSHPECVEYGMIRCPSKKCDFSCCKTRESVRMCLLLYGFVPNYKTWCRHGESDIEMGTNNEDGETYESWVNEMLTEAAGPTYEPSDENPNAQSKMFYDLFMSANEPLWKGCKSDTTLSAVSQVLHFKSEYGIPIKGVDQILSFIKRLLPLDNKLPDSYYQCKAMMKGLGLPSEKIHACENDCVLFWKNNKDLETCPVCAESRYKLFDVSIKEKRKPIPRKVLRYFPIIPRLQRLYLSSKTAEHMRWHGTKRMDVQGELRHPADGEAWKDFDKMYPSFAADARNIRLGLATDGFNPFGNSSKPHSTWPVFIVPYNLPPWMCMKNEYIFMPLVIPGPKGPGRELDVYLEPLIDELKSLWNFGVDTYDISLKQNFNMRAALLWTISDFPSYGMLSGWSTHGKNSCPCCLDTSIAFNLTEGRKPCYFGCHRRWLSPNHRWRSDKYKFNNKTERKMAPQRQSGDEILAYVSKFDSIVLGKGDNSDEKPLGFGIEHNWTKKSIFFELPYWSKLLIRHNLDVMHIEKNVFDNVFNTVMNVRGRTKDNLKSRKDLKILGIRAELHPIERPNRTLILPKAKYTLTNEQTNQVYEWLQLLKVPDGYAGNISRCVNPKECKMSGLKTHDCHVLMERFLPIPLREFLPKEVWEPLNALSQFFKYICSKVYKEEELEKLELSIVETLCKLEMIFPPSFFDSMEHLPIHLAYEAKLGGPVQYRWMYPFERCMQYLKKKVRNKACPEGSIAEAYWTEEIVNFCSHYFGSNIMTKFNRSDRNDDGGHQEFDGGVPVFARNGRAFGKAMYRWLSCEELNAVALYVLLNCDYEKAYDKIKYFRFKSPEEETKGRVIWERMCSKMYPKFMYRWKDQALKKHKTIAIARNHHPKWTTPEVWQQLWTYWTSDKFVKASELRIQNRASKAGIPHASGNITFEERDMKLFKSLGRRPTQWESFNATRMSKRGGSAEKKFITEDAEKFSETYANKLREANGLEPTAPVKGVDDPGLKIYEELVGGVRKGRLPGRPGERWSKRSGQVSSSDFTAQVAMHQSSQEVKKLKEEMAKINSKNDKVNSENAKVISNCNGYIQCLYQYIEAIAEKNGDPPPPRPPVFRAAFDTASNTHNNTSLTNQTDEGQVGDKEMGFSDGEAHEGQLGDEEMGYSDAEANDAEMLY